MSPRPGSQLGRRVCDGDQLQFRNPAWPHSAGEKAPRREADFGERLCPYHRESPGRHPRMLIRWHGTSRGWEQGPVCVCVCVHTCTSVCERAHACAAQTASNRQRLQKHIPTVLITAACGSYKYCYSRTKIGIYALLRLRKSLHQAGEDGQQQALSPKRVPCPSRTELTVLGASPRGRPLARAHSPSVTTSL